MGVVSVLVLTALSALRYRFINAKLQKALPCIELVVCVLYAFYWIPALLGLWFPAIGFFENRNKDWERESLLREYDDRAIRLKLEKERENSAHYAANAARLAEIN
jgi:hypothetical protein